MPNQSIQNLIKLTYISKILFSAANSVQTDIGTKLPSEFENLSYKNNTERYNFMVENINAFSKKKYGGNFASLSETRKTKIQRIIRKELTKSEKLKLTNTELLSGIKAMLNKANFNTDALSQFVKRLPDMAPENINQNLKILFMKVYNDSASQSNSNTSSEIYKTQYLELQKGINAKLSETEKEDYKMQEQPEKSPSMQSLDMILSDLEEDENRNLMNEVNDLAGYVDLTNPSQKNTNKADIPEKTEKKITTFARDKTKGREMFQLNQSFTPSFNSNSIMSGASNNPINNNSNSASNSSLDTESMMETFSQSPAKLLKTKDGMGRPIAITKKVEKVSSESASPDNTSSGSISFEETSSTQKPKSAFSRYHK